MTGEPLIQRSDDTEETLKKRLETYHKQTTPVIGYYKQKGLLHTLDASANSKDVYAAMRAVLDRKK